MQPLPYLHGYPPDTLARVHELLAAGTLAEVVARRHPVPSPVRNERELYDYVCAFKARHLKTAPPLSKVVFDPRLQLVAQALGTHTAISRVQGGRLRAKREIRIASVFREAPADFLRTIVVHELAHLREREHDKAFYALCRHMEPDYHALEFDLRLWLTARDAAAPAVRQQQETTCRNPS